MIGFGRKLDANTDKNVTFCPGILSWDLVADTTVQKLKNPTPAGTTVKKLEESLDDHITTAQLIDMQVTPTLVTMRQKYIDAHAQRQSINSHVQLEEIQDNI
jgi:hypothetical protein